MNDELKRLLKKEQLRVEMMREELIKDMDKMSVYQIENERLKEKVNQLETKINTYENPEDMTLMFMWCDEKAKDKIKELKQKVNQLEANWDELKGWLKANDIHYAEAIPFREALNKMQELERGKEDV